MSQGHEPEHWVGDKIESVIRKVEEARFVALGFPVRLCVASVHPAPDGTTTNSVVFRLAVRPQDNSSIVVEHAALRPRIYGATLTTDFYLTGDVDSQVKELVRAARQQLEALANDEPVRKVITIESGVSAVRVATVFVTSAFLTGGLAVLYYFRSYIRISEGLSLIAAALALAAVRFIYRIYFDPSATTEEVTTPTK